MLCFTVGPVLLLATPNPAAVSIVEPHGVFVGSAVRWAEACPVAFAVTVVLATSEVVGDLRTVGSTAPDAVAHPVLLAAHLVAGLSGGWWMVRVLAGGGS